MLPKSRSPARQLLKAKYGSLRPAAFEAGPALSAGIKSGRLRYGKTHNGAQTRLPRRQAFLPASFCLSFLFLLGAPRFAQKALLNSTRYRGLNFQTPAKDRGARVPSVA